MKAEHEGKPDASDDYDLSDEKANCPEINNSWWPHSIPTDAPSK